LKRHIGLVEPLSLDEAYLDVTKNKIGLATATIVARTIREQISQALNQTASAGVGPKRFLAKLASDWRKPSRAAFVSGESASTTLDVVCVAGGQWRAASRSGRPSHRLVYSKRYGGVGVAWQTRPARLQFFAETWVDKSAFITYTEEYGEDVPA